MNSCVRHVNKGKPEMSISLLKNDIEFFPSDKIKGHISLKSGNFLKKGVINYEIYSEEKIIEKIKYNIECYNKTEIYSSSLQYPELIDFSLTNGIEIPFELNLPSYILPSFEFSLNKKTNYGYIKTFLEIKIQELNLSKNKFIVIKRPKLILYSPLNITAERNEKILGIINKGCPLFSAEYEKNYYYINEIIKVKIHLDYNDSKFNIKYINVDLIRRVIYKLKDNYENDNITFYEPKYKNSNKIDDIIFTDILSHEQIKVNNDINNKNQNQIFEINIKVKDPENIFNKYKIDYMQLGLKDKSNLISFLPSFDSCLFKCEYFIQVSSVYDTKLPVKDMVINLPLSIYHFKEEEKNSDEEFLLLKSGIARAEIGNSEVSKEEQVNNNKEEKYEIKSYDKKSYTNNEKGVWNSTSNGGMMTNGM